MIFMKIILIMSINALIEQADELESSIEKKLEVINTLPQSISSKEFR